MKGPQQNTYYFQLLPHYLKVDHAYAKNIKPNTLYRLTVYKGVQLIEEMQNPIKAKIVGGKIVFDGSILAFSLANFAPTRNIEYTIKLTEIIAEKSETEVASHKIKSGDYVRKFRGQQGSRFSQEVQLVENLTIVFDLFVHNSKEELDKAVQENIPKQLQSAINQRKNDVQGSQTSSKRKFSRRRGHDGRLRSRQGSAISSQRSVSSKGNSAVRKGQNLVSVNRKNTEGSKAGSRTPPRSRQQPQRRIHDLQLLHNQKVVDFQTRRTNAQIPAQNNLRQKTQQSQQNQRQNRLKTQPEQRQRVETTKQRSQIDPKRRIHDLQLVHTENVVDLQPRRAKVQKSGQEKAKQEQQEQPSNQNRENTQERKRSRANYQSQDQIRQQTSKQAANEQEPAPIQSVPQERPPSIISQSAKKPESVVGKLKPLSKGPATVRSQRDQSNSTKEQPSTSDATSQALFYIIFVIVSSVLFYLALTPARKV